VISVVEKTPGAVFVSKTKHDITAKCELEGYTQTDTYLESGTEGATWGNILAGGLIGWGVDSATGSDNKYPEYTTIQLVSNDSIVNEEVADSGDVTGRLEKLKELKNKGLITSAEYKQKRDKIVKEM
jgi:hypothetical protein